MIDKDPSAYSVLTYMWVLGLSLWGGIVSFMRKLRSGESRIFNFTELVGELVTSGFAGMITFYLCQFADISDLLTSVLVGISGHMGSRAIFQIEKWAMRRFPK